MSAVVQLDLFGNPTTPPPARAGVLVRSHIRHLRGAAPAAPHNGTQTSRAAAVAVEASGKATTDRAKVLECIKRAGERGITRADIQATTGIGGDTVRPRVHELLGKQKDKAGLYPAPLIEELEETRIPDCGGTVRQKVLRCL